MKQILSGILMGFILMVPGLTVHAAGSATMGLDQSSYEVVQGEYVDIAVTLEPQGESIDTVRAVLTFDPNILLVQTVRLSGGFERTAPGNYIDNANGKLSWGAFTLEGPVTSNTSVVSVTFIAIASGEARVRISGDSRVISNGEEKLNTSKLGQSTVQVEEAPNTDSGAAVLILASDSHPEEGVWSNTTQIDVSWTALAGESPIEAYYYSFGLEADPEPSVYLEGSTQTLTLNATQDGPYYFRIKGVHEGGAQTPIAQRMILVDTTAPNPIQLTAQDDKLLEGESAWFTFGTTDDTSGVAQYQVAMNNSQFQAQSSPLEIVDLTPGTYLFRVAALDYAGNTTYGSATVRVYPNGTELSRPEGYDQAREAQSIQSAIGEAVEEISSDSTLLITIVLGAIVLFGIIYATRKRNSNKHHGVR